MKTYFDCYPCFLRQALSAARRVGADEQQEYAVMQGVLNTLLAIQPQNTPPQIAYSVHKIVRAAVATDDPYKDAKSKSTADALELYPKLKHMVAQSSDPLDMAIRISIAGNIIDFGYSDQEQDLWRTIEATIHKPYAIDDTKKLRSKLNEARKILFLAQRYIS